MDLLLFTFAGGTVLVAVIFFLAVSRRAAPRPAKHALGKRAPQSAAGPYQRQATAPTSAQPADPGDADDTPTEPQLPIATLPSDLFERRYAARFHRLRERVQRLQVEVNGQ